MQRHIGAERRQTALKAAAVVAILSELQTTLREREREIRETNNTKSISTQDQRLTKEEEVQIFSQSERRGNKCSQ